MGQEHRAITMIRITFALRRKQNLEFEEFQEYWREKHGPLVASHSSHLKIRRYVQVHTLGNPDAERPEGERGKMQRPFDGVAELWFDSLDDIRNSDSAAVDASLELLEDERQFIDLSQSPGWLAYECPQINPSPEKLVASPDSPYAKLYYLLNYPEGRSFDEVQLYWRMNHGPLVRHYGPLLQILRYVQVHRFDDEFNDTFASARGTVIPAYFGHAELWYDQRRPANQSPFAKKGETALYEDEAKFIDFSRSALWFAKEHVFVDRQRY
tara:strand:- start:21256 stop:22059 length:804 start_codon:yes stop_codon:yes gene_type:complete